MQAVFLLQRYLHQQVDFFTIKEKAVFEEKKCISWIIRSATNYFKAPV